VVDDDELRPHHLRLAELLANRDKQILEPLVQRLRGQEIADRFFGSPATIII
jgi:hypothetical protein